MSLFHWNKPKINTKCAYFKRKGVEEQKTKKNHKNKKLTYKSYKTAGQKLKIKKIRRDQVREKMRKGKKKEKGCILDMKIFNP